MSSGEDIRVEVRGLRAFGPHGVTEAERAVGCWVEIDLSVLVRGSRASVSDDVADTVDYGRLAAIAAGTVREESCRTLERIGGLIADRVSDELGVRDLTIRVAKPSPPIADPLTDVGVTLVRGNG